MRLADWKTAVRNYFIRPRQLALMAALISLLVLIPSWYLFQKFMGRMMIDENRQAARENLSRYANILETELGRQISLAETLKTFTIAELKSSDYVDPLHLQSILTGLYESSSGIEFFSVDLAGNDLILFPADAAARQSYTELSDDLEIASKSAAANSQSVIFGPYQSHSGQQILLVQGKIITDGEDRGTASLVFALDPILSAADLNGIPLSWVLLGDKDVLLAGEVLAASLDPVRHEINLPGQIWELQAAPIQGWNKAAGPVLPIIRWFSLATAVLLAALAATLLNRHERLKKLVNEKTRQLSMELEERQKMAAALQESEEQSRLIVESAMDAIFIEDELGRILECNDFACNMYGYSRDELLKLSVVELVPASVHEDLPNIINQDVLDGKIFTQSYGVRKSGAVFPTEVNIRRVQSQNAVQLIVFVRDLTESRREKLLLAESELRYRTLMEVIPESIILTDLEGGVLFANQIAAELNEFSTPDELIGCSMFELINIEDRSPVEQYMQRVLTQGQVKGLQLRLPRQNGSTFWMEFDSTLISGLAGQPDYILIVGRDITSRQEAEAARLLQTTALEAAANGIVITNTDGIILWVNPAFTQLTGYSAAEAVGQHTRLLNSGLHPSEFYAEMWSEISSGKVWSRRLTNRKKDGSLYTEEMTITPVQNPARPDLPARITHYIAIKQDVTERERIETRQAAIASITSALRTATKREEIIEIILRQTLELLEVHGAAVMMRQPDDGRLICEQGAGDWGNWKGIQVSGQTGATARVLTTLQPFVENNVSTSQEPLIRRIFTGEQAIACIPLIAPLQNRLNGGSEPDNHKEQVQGILWVGRNRSFLESEIRVLVSIADIAVGAIQRAALYDETRQRLQRLMSIHALDSAITSSLDVQVLLNELLNQLTGDLGVDAADVMLISADGWTLRCAAAVGFKMFQGCSPHEIRLGEGLAGRAALERKPMVQNNLVEEYPPTELERLAGEEICGRVALPMLAKGELKGVLEVFYRQQMAFDPEWVEYLETLAGQAAIAIDNAQLFDQAQRSSKELAAAYDTTLEGWARALELRDRETEGHTRRAAELTIRLGRRLGMSEAELVHVWRGAILHDIGKLGIPDEILSKPGALTEEEWQVMREHPRLGYELLKPIPYLAPALEIPYCHHEHWDGKGYPRQLKGERIPLSARIFAVADVWDALRSDRPYRPAWDNAATRAYIVQNSGTHFDPQVVEAFEHLLDEEGTN